MKKIIAIFVVLILGFMLFYKKPVYFIEDDHINKIVMSNVSDEYTVLNKELVITDQNVIDSLIEKVSDYNLLNHKVEAIDSIMPLLVTFYDNDKVVISMELNEKFDADDEISTYCHIYNKVEDQVYFQLPKEFMKEIHRMMKS